MKYLFLIPIVFMLFIPVAVSADVAVDNTPSLFLQEINSASNYNEIGLIIGNYADGIGFDLAGYNNLSAANKIIVLKTIVGKQYLSVSEFVTSFEQAIAKTTQSDSGKSSGGGGGTSISIVKQFTCEISGVISLPQGEVAPEGGFEFDLYFNEGFKPTHTIVTIPTGYNSIEYACSYQVLSGQSNIRGRLTLSGDADAKYQTCTYTEALPLSEENNDLTVNVEIQYAQRKLGGVFRLPDDMEVLSDDLPIDINISKDDFKFYVSKTLLAGSREVEFLVGVSATEYNVSYYANTYGKIGLQHICPAGEAVNDVALEDDCTDIMLDAGWQNYVEGYIRLPEGESAPEGGLLISVGSVTVEMPQGTSEVYYRSGVYYNAVLYCSVITENHPATQFVGGYYITEGILSRDYSRRVYFENLNENLTIDLSLRLLQCVEGVISLCEPLIGGASAVIKLNGEAYSYSASLYIEEGETSIPYRILLEESVGSQCYINLTIKSDSEKYLTTSRLGEFTVEETFTQYDISDFTVEKKAVLISGNIGFAEGMTAAEDTAIFLYFKNDYYDFSYNVTIKKDENSAMYAIYGYTAETSDYAGEYTLSVHAYFLSNQRLYYTGSGFTFKPTFRVTVENETILQDLVLPEPNREIRGSIIMPAPAEIYMQIDIMVFSDYGDAIYTSVAVSEGSDGLDYAIKFLIPNESRDYKIGYKIESPNGDAYYSGLFLYISDDGFTPWEYESKIFDLYGQSEPFEVNLDLSGLKVGGYIKGKFILPDSYIIPTAKYFTCSVSATNGEHPQPGSFRINAGYNSASYMIPVPEVYKDGEWTVYYSLGDMIIQPFEPVVPPSPGTSTGGVVIVNPKPSGWMIPENLLQSYKIYVAPEGKLSFYEQNARRFVFDEGGFENIDIYALSTDTPVPRMVGGFFTSVIEVPDEGIAVSVILQSIDGGEELVQSFIFTGEAVRYIFETYGEGDYILKYEIGGETFYYQNNYKLIMDIASASVIKTAGVPAQYKKDVYYNNIYPASYYAKTLSVSGVSDLVGNAWDTSIKIYNTDGVLLSEGYMFNKINTQDVPIVIGYEIGGYKAYFTEYDSKLLSGSTTDFSKAARIYLVPLLNYVAYVNVNIPHIGYADGIGTNAKIENSYFNYRVTIGGKINISSFFVSAVDAEEVENETVFIACFEKSGKLKFIKSIRLTSGDQFIDLDWIINKTDTVKVIGMGGNMNPLFEQLSFFGE